MQKAKIKLFVSICIPVILIVTIFIVYFTVTKKPANFLVKSYDEATALIFPYSDNIISASENFEGRWIIEYRNKDAFIINDVIGHENFLNSLHYYDEEEIEQKTEYLFLVNHYYFILGFFENTAYIMNLCYNISPVQFIPFFNNSLFINLTHNEEGYGGSKTFTYVELNSSFPYNMQENLYTDYETIKNYYKNINSDYYNYNDEEQTINVKYYLKNNFSGGYSEYYPFTIKCFETSVEISILFNE